MGSFCLRARQVFPSITPDRVAILRRGRDMSAQGGGSRRFAAVRVVVAALCPGLLCDGPFGPRRPSDHTPTEGVVGLS